MCYILYLRHYVTYNKIYIDFDYLFVSKPKDFDKI